MCSLGIMELFLTFRAALDRLHLLHLHTERVLFVPLYVRERPPPPKKNNCVVHYASFLSSEMRWIDEWVEIDTSLTFFSMACGRNGDLLKLLASLLFHLYMLCGKRPQPDGRWMGCFYVSMPYQIELFFSWM